MAWKDIARWTKMTEDELLAELGVPDENIGAIVVNNCYELMTVESAIVAVNSRWESAKYESVFEVLTDRYPEKTGPHWAGPKWYMPGGRERDW